jgi:hypothetical protein
VLGWGVRHVWGTKRVLAGKEATWKAHVLIGRIILKWDLKLIRFEGVDDLTSLRPSCCEDSNERSRYVKCMEFLDYVTRTLLRLTKTKHLHIMQFPPPPLPSSYVAIRPSSETAGQRTIFKSKIPTSQ